MSFADDLWLGSVAARRNLVHLMTYGTALCGNAAWHGMHLGLSAPRLFVTAMARAAKAPGTALLEPPADLPAMPANDVAPPAAMPEPAAMTEPVVMVEPEPVVMAEPEPVVVQLAAVPDAAPSPTLLDEPRGGAPDDLTALAGVGTKLAATLNEFGIYHFDQIAGLDEAGLNWLNDQQPGFKALQARFDLIGQARALG